MHHIRQHSYGKLLYSFFSYTVNNDITVPADQVWVFSSSTSNQQCFDVVIVPDNLVESDETFELTLTTTNEAITLTPVTTVITVTNDDCELLFVYYIC